MMFDRSDRPRISLSLNDPQTCLESLEPRLLLSTLFGGETFEFQDAAQQRVIVSVGGNVVVEVIGGTVNINNNTVILHQMPGDVLTSDIGRGENLLLGRRRSRLNGGFAGQKGSDPVTLDPLRGAEISFESGLEGTIGGDLLSVNALASNAEGDTYGFNYFEPQTSFGPPTIQLFRFVDHGRTGAVELPVASLGTGIRTLVFGGPPPEDNPPVVRSVDAAAFNPVDGRLYFVASVDRPDLPESPQGIEYLFSVDVSGPMGSVSSTMRLVDPSGSFGDVDGDAQLQVHSIAFDQVLDTPGNYGTSGAPSSYLWAYYTQQGTDTEEGVLSRYPVSGGAGPAVVNTRNPIYARQLIIGQGDDAQPVLTIRGIDFNTFNPTALEDNLFAITNEGGSSSMLRLEITYDPLRPTVAIINHGTTFDPDDPDFTVDASDDAFQDELIRGESPGSLTWNPILINPYTGRQGVFLFADTETDDLMFVSELQRFGEANAFFIYVTQGDPNGYITISTVTLDETTGERTITPYEGTLPDLRLWGLAAGDFIGITPSGVGGALLGAVTLDLNPADPEDDLIPLLQASLTGSRLDDFYGSLGTLPAGVESVTPGLVVARSLLRFYQPGSSVADRLLKQNMDVIEGLSASRDGRTLAVIDTDAKDPTGTAYSTPSDELAFYDTLTRTLTTPVRVYYDVDPPGPDTVTYLSNVQGLDYGGGFTDEKLFAIYDIDTGAGTDLRLGTLESDGEFTLVAGDGQINSSIVAVQAMAFTPNQTQLYIIGLNVSGEARLYRYTINPATGALSGFTTIGLLVDAATGAAMTNFGSMDFTANTVGGLPQLLAHDRHNGRLVDVALTAVSGEVRVGANVATEKGSLRPTVGAITYDRVNNRMFASDNTFGLAALRDEDSRTLRTAVGGVLTVTHEAVDESAAIMVLTGMTSTSARPQDLGKFLFGGAVTGAVFISGSMDTFYAGWIILGNSRGQQFYGSPEFPVNFFVGGDLMTLITPVSLGGVLSDTGDPGPLQDVVYATGFDMVVNGRLGMLRASRDFLGSVQVRNSIAPGDLDFRYTSTPELEVRRWRQSAEAAARTLGDEWLAGNLVWLNLIGETDYLLNDADPQFLGALPVTAVGADTNLVNGRLTWSEIGQPDTIDMYAVALMGGQTISLQLTTGELQVFLFGPDGQLVPELQVVASNASRLGGYHHVFAYKAEKPGVYRIGIFDLGDLNHDGVSNDGVNFIEATTDYELRIGGLGDLALGGLSAGRHIYSMDMSSPAFEVDAGDLGALWAGNGTSLAGVGAGSIFFSVYADPLWPGFPGVSSVRVVSGNLRVMQGASIGLEDNEFSDDFYNDPEIEVWDGNVGLIRSGGFMAIDIGTLTFLDDVRDAATRAELNALNIRPIGGDVQFIDAGVDTEVESEFWGNVRVNGSIGVFRADDVEIAILPVAVSPLVPTSFEVNASGTRTDAVFDMIDIRGDWGDDQDGGIPLSVGHGGNIRFVKVAGSIYNDRFFGMPSSARMRYDIDPDDPDKWVLNPVRIVDDGGAVFYVAPLRDVANPAYNPVSSPNLQPSMPNFLIITALGVRNSGGVVVARIQAGQPDLLDEINIDGALLPITGGVAVWGVSGRAAEIGQIFVGHAPRGGEGVPTDNPGGATGSQWTVNVLLRGPVALDVYDIEGNENVVFSRIRNDSGYRNTSGVFVGGNLYNGLVQGVGELYTTGNLGLAYGSTGANLSGTRELVFEIPEYQTELRDTLYPMGLRDTGWVIRRSDSSPAVVGRIASGRAMGNLLIAGDVREIIADEDHSFRSDDDIYEGIAGPIWVTNIYHDGQDGGGTSYGGEVELIDIGEGIAPGGTSYELGGGIVVGDMAGRAPDGVLGRIGTVRNRGLGSDIAGAIVSTGVIERINVTDGALIGARIFAGLIVHFWAAEPQSYRRPEFWETVGNIDFFYEIGSVNISGRGGIIGSYIGSNDIASVAVRGGFGVINSIIEMGHAGSLASLYADGYGIRDTRIIGGNRIGDITLGGRGPMVAASPLIFTPSVFQSELGLNPFGQPISEDSDLHAYLGTSASLRLISGVTDTGVIEDSVVQAANSLGNVRAYQIRTRGGTDEPSGLTSFQIAIRIASIQTLSLIDGLNIVTGELVKFLPASDVNRLRMTVAGPIQSINIRGSLLGSSSIVASGPHGYINQILIAGDLVGSIESSGKINKIQIGGDLSGDIIIHGTGVTSRGYALGSLILGGSLLDGSLDVTGNVNQIQIAGGMGVLGDELRIRGNLRTLIVGSNRAVTDASMDLDLIVEGDLGSLIVNGPINGQVLVGGTLASLVLTNRTGSPIDLIAAPVAVHGDLKSATLTDGRLAADLSVGGALGALNIRNGNVAADVTAGGSINQFNLTGGSILADATVTSSLGDIKSLTITGGDLLGQVRAPNGQIVSLTIRGSDLGPAALVEAAIIRALKIDGTVRAGATILASSELWSLIVGGDVESGAVITAGSAKDIQVRGDLAASMTFGRGTWDATTLTVGGDLGSSGSVIDLASGVNVRVTGSILDGAILAAGRDVQLQVTGDVAGDVIAGGKIQRLSAGSLTDAVVVAGYDITAMTVTGAVTGSLVQAGASRLDGASVFDAGTARSGAIVSLSIGSALDSILAAGGSIKSFAGLSMTNSSLSAGLVLAGARIDQVRGGALDLAVAADRNTARQGVSLFRGDILSLTGGDLVASQVSAGVDPGIDGSFVTDADNTVLTSRTGGSSSVTVKSINLDAASRILADGAIVAQQTMGAGEVNNASVAYTLADLTAHNPLETLLGAAIANVPLSVTTDGGHVVTFTLSGPGALSVYDEAGADTDDLIDSLVLTGTTSASSLVITTSTPGGVAIGRVLTADDATIGRFSFDGDLVGDGTDDPDFWVDGSMSVLSFRDLGDDFSGRVGGDVTTLTIRTQGGGSLVVGGAIQALIVADSSGSGIFDDLAAAPLASIRQMAVSDAGATWVFDTATRKIGQIDLTTGALIGSTFSVTDPLAFGAAAVLDVTAMDFGLDSLSASRLLAVVSVLDLSPTVRMGALTSGSATLRALAVNSAGQAFAIDSSTGTDHLVRIDTATGGIAEDRGQIRDIFGNTYTANITALTFDAAGVLYGVTTDLDGNGSTLGPFDGAALVKIETSASAGRDHLLISGPGSNALGILLNGGSFVGSVRGMVARGNGAFYIAVNTGFGSSLLDVQFTDNLSPTPDTVIATLIGAITADGLTGIVGLGYDANGNLLGLSVTGGQAAMVKIDTTTPASSTLISAVGVIDASIDAFAIYAPTGGTPTSYAYDTDAALGLFLTSPGVVATLGTIETAAGPTQGQFDRLATLAKDTLGAPLGESITAFAVAGGAGGHVFVVTESGLLYEYDESGLLQNSGAIGTVADRYTGQAVHIVGMDFNAAGELVGLDSFQNRIVTISIVDALATPRTDSGVAPTAGIAALTFDPIDERFVAVRTTDNALVELVATTQAEYEAIAGGIIADSINRISITGSDYAGRIATTGNTIGNVDVQGAFAGQISAASISSYNQRAGDFSGTITALDGIKQFQLAAGSLLADGFVRAGGTLGRLSVKGDLAGSVSGLVITQLSVTGEVAATGRIIATNELGSADIRGDFDGRLEAGSVRSTLKIGGALGATGRLTVDRDVQTLQISGGVAAGGAVVIGGSARTLTVGQTFAGVIDVGLSVSSAGFGTLSAGRVGIGTGLTNLTVSGDMLNSVISVGTRVGPDGLYNTADDVILGGSIQRATIRGNMTNSALVAGVLPKLASGPGMPASKLDYTDETATAGGIGRSTIGTVSISRLIAGSALAAADGITKVSGPNTGQLSQRVLSDPLGAPTVISVAQSGTMDIYVTLSEMIDLASVILSVDADGDQLLDGPADVIGSLSLINADGDYISSNIALTLTALPGDNGRTLGLLRIQRTGGLNFTSEGTLGLRLIGSLDPDVASVTDRSGRRSGLLNFNLHDDPARQVGDPFGTILNDGSDFAAGLLTEDPANTFAAVVLDTDLTVNGQAVSFGQDFSTASDVEVFRFNASAYEFFSWQLDTTAFIYGTLFLLDDQGTADSSDDTYEAVAVPTFNGQSAGAYELPETGTYYLVLSPTWGSIPSTTYQLSMMLASSDDMLDGAVNGLTGLPSYVDVAYISNTVGEHSNLLGANTPKQLVYLNFDGGQTAQYDINVEVAAFDPGRIDIDLSVHRDLFISGGAIQDVTVQSISDQVASIYSNTPASNPLGTLNVQVLGGDLSAYNAAGSGLFLTTVDPALSGLDPLTDYTTIYIGQTPSYWKPGNLGVANDIDTANMNKSGEAVIYVQNFAGYSLSSGLTDRVIEYSRLLANVVAHELGHTLGLNHQPTSFADYFLRPDDSANGQLSAMNDGVGVRQVSGDDFRITTRNNTAINIDIAGLTTVEQVVDLINITAGGLVTASIDAAEGRIILTDSTTGFIAFAVTAIGGSQAASDLGILKSVASGVTTITGDAVLTIGQSNVDTGMMAYAPPFVWVSVLSQLGTADVSPSEFPIGQIDTAESLLRWLA